MIIPEGYYRNEHHLINTINDLFKKHKTYFIYNDATRKVEIQIGKGLQLHIQRELAGTLGLSYTQIICSSPLYQGPYLMEMTRGIDALYVYTDVIQTRLVGDSCVPLL